MAHIAAVVAGLKSFPDRRQLESMEAAFKKADKNGDGFLTADEYYAVFKEHGVECSMEEIANIMAKLDKNHDGKISLGEFTGRPEQDPNARSELAFNLFDQNHDGFVTRQEMLSGSSNLKPEHVEAVFQRNDKDHDEKLNLEEFQDFINKHRQRKAEEK